MWLLDEQTVMCQARQFEDIWYDNSCYGGAAATKASLSHIYRGGRMLVPKGNLGCKLISTGMDRES